MGLNLLQFFSKLNLTWIILGGFGLIWVITLVNNIVKGTFSVSKFFSGFSIFSGGVQGKLIYYFIVFSIVAAVALGIYHRMTQETFQNNYKNNIRNNEIVNIDQRQLIEAKEDTLLIGIKLFGLKVGITYKDATKQTTNVENKTEEVKKEEIIIPEIKPKLNPLFAPFRWIRKIM